MDDKTKYDIKAHKNEQKTRVGGTV